MKDNEENKEAIIQALRGDLKVCEQANFELQKENKYLRFLIEAHFNED